MKPFQRRCKRLLVLLAGAIPLALCGCVTYPYYGQEGVYYGRSYDGYGYSDYGYAGGDYYSPYPYYAYPGYYGRSLYSFSYYDYSPYYRYPYSYYPDRHDRGRRHDEHPGSSGDARRELNRVSGIAQPPTVDRSPPRGRHIKVDTPEPVRSSSPTRSSTGIVNPGPRTPAPETRGGTRDDSPRGQMDRPRRRDR